MCDCDDATVFFNFYIYLVFLGECLAHVPSFLLHLRELRLEYCENLRYEYVKKLEAALPKLEVNICGNLRNEHQETTSNCSTSDSN